MYRSLAFQINPSNRFQMYIFKSFSGYPRQTVSLVRKPSSTHPSHLFWEHTQVFPGQLGCIVPPVWPWSAMRSPQGCLCLKHLAREAPRRHDLSRCQSHHMPGLLWTERSSSSPLVWLTNLYESQTTLRGKITHFRTLEILLCHQQMKISIIKASHITLLN